MPKPDFPKRKKRMIAHHPVTGKEVRIINSDASLWKDKKTLYWSKDGKTTPWDAVQISTDLNVVSQYRILLQPVENSVLEIISRSSRLVFVSRNALVEKPNVRNLICLEEMEAMYPHLGSAWDGSEEDAIILVAGLLSYRYIAIDPSSSFTNRTSRAQKLGLQIETKPPARLWWVTQYYVPDKAKRKREIDTCLLRNVESPLIDKIILLNERNEKMPESVAHAVADGRIEERVIGGRLT
jgi:hypothetical protein